LGGKIVFIQQWLRALWTFESGPLRDRDMLLSLGILAILEVGASSPSDSHYGPPFFLLVRDISQQPGKNSGHRIFQIQTLDIS
jgi:hypothetical protein